MFEAVQHFVENVYPIVLKIVDDEGRRLLDIDSVIDFRTLRKIEVSMANWYISRCLDAAIAKMRRRYECSFENRSGSIWIINARRLRIGLSDQTGFEAYI